mgnify:CR=1 FL=1
MGSEMCIRDSPWPGAPPGSAVPTPALAPPLSRGFPGRPVVRQHLGKGMDRTLGGRERRGRRRSRRNVFLPTGAPGQPEPKKGRLGFKASAPTVVRTATSTTGPGQHTLPRPGRVSNCNGQLASLDLPVLPWLPPDPVLDALWEPAPFWFCWPGCCWPELPLVRVERHWLKSSENFW